MRTVAESYLIKQTQCPECAKQGRDNSKDNLAVYSDGHSYCYQCGHYEHGDVIKAFKGRQEPLETIKDTDVYLPEDVSTEYPYRALQWVSQYELTKVDLLNHGVLWSDYYHRLIFPVYSSDGVLAWQGRYFGEEKQAKWFGRGNLRDTYHILGTNQEKLVLTEDIISAIKVSKYYQAMPLFGSHIGLQRFKRLSMLVDEETEVVVWLDFDKAKEALKEAKLGALYNLNVRTIVAELDPKEYSYNEIQGFLR